MNSDELASRQNAQPTPTHKGRSYDNLQIAGNAVVHLGDRYGSNKDLFEEGSETENRHGEPMLLPLGAVRASVVVRELTTYLQHSSMFSIMKV